MKNKGITLISLVITIIILLILAGISIVAITGDNGLFNRAKQAKQAQIEAEMKENLNLAINELQLEKVGNAKIDDITQEWANSNLSEYNPEIKNIDDGEHQESAITLTKKGITKKYTINQKLEIKEIDFSEITVNTAGYILVEVSGVFAGSDGAALNELEVYNNNGEKIEYTVLKDLEYDSVDNGKSNYWEDMRYWNYTNLNDGEYEYKENYPTGGLNCTLFINHGNTDSWARFIINLGTQVNIEQIKIAVGGYDEFNSTRSRTPKKITIYDIDNFIDGTEQDSTYINNIRQRNNIGLSKIAEKEINEVLTTVTKVSLLNN